MKLFLTKRGIKDKNGPAAGPGHRWRLPGVGSGGVSFRTKVLLWLKKTELLKSANISSPENNHHDHQQQYFFCARVDTLTHTRLSIPEFEFHHKKVRLKSRPPPEKKLSKLWKHIIVTYTKCRSRRRHHHHHAKPSNIKERKKQKDAKFTRKNHKHKLFGAKWQSKSQKTLFVI